MFQSKYILIAGPARMGKSIIRQKLLEKYQIAGFCTDSLVAMLDFASPELGINFTNSEYSKIRKYVQGLLTYQNNYPLVMEGVGIGIEDWPIYHLCPSQKIPKICNFSLFIWVEVIRSQI